MLLISHALEVFGDAGKVREGVRAFAVKLNQMDIPVAARVGPASVDDESHMDRIGNLTVITAALRRAVYHRRGYVVTDVQRTDRDNCTAMDTNMCVPSTEMRASSSPNRVVSDL